MQPRHIFYISLTIGIILGAIMFAFAFSENPHGMLLDEQSGKINYGVSVLLFIIWSFCATLILCIAGFFIRFAVRLIRK